MSLKINEEPVVILGSITKAIQGVIACLLLFGAIHWSPAQVGGIILAIEGIVGVPLMFLARSKSTPSTPSGT